MESESQFDYGITFWDPEIDSEICVRFKARHYDEAEKIMEPFQIPGYKKGVVEHLGAVNLEFYTWTLEDLKEKVGL